MYLLNVFLLYCTVPWIIANNLTILTDWKRSTLQCMNNYFENTGFWTTHDTFVTILGLDEKEGMYIL
jgi:hypothetical protein